MQNIKIEGISSTLGEIIFTDTQYIKQHLDKILTDSNTTIIKNLLKETNSLLREAEDNSKTDKEKYRAFYQITLAWLDVWEEYKEIPQAIDLIRTIYHLTNFSFAYSYLFLSLWLINEERTGEYKEDLKIIIGGFLLLAGIIDVFIEFFSISELVQIRDYAKKAMSLFSRNVRDYLEDGIESSNLVTQLRSYSSLIILRIEEYIESTESTLQTNSDIETDVLPQPWWEEITGTFADDPVYDEAMRLGREYRELLRPDATELSDL